MNGMDMNQTVLNLKSDAMTGLKDTQIEDGLKKAFASAKPKKILLVPPDITRFYSKAGFITNKLYHMFKEKAQVDVIPALGTHKPMTEDECMLMFGDIPYDRFLIHDWRNDVVEIGKVPADFIASITDGLWDKPVTIEVNKRIVNNDYDLICSIGQVVPHEVIGMANHAKNILVGLGGKSTINKSHMVGAVYGMERMMGKGNTPVRQILDYGMKHFLNDLPLTYLLTVTTAKHDDVSTHGVFIGPKKETFEQAVSLSQKKNITFLDRPIKKCIVYLDPREFRSTWLGNKAVYRTRMAIEDGGELIILAPNVKEFGEDETIDRLIRAYGYQDRLSVLKAVDEHKELQENMGVAAHLIHGSSEGRFSITYAVKHLTKKQIENVNYHYQDYDHTIKIYNPDILEDGWNTLKNGEEIYFISNPALGLWIDRQKFEQSNT